MGIAKSAEISVRQVIHDDKWVTADLVDVKFDNGKEMKNFLRLTAKNGGYVMVIPRLRDGRFILTRQFKPVAGVTIEGVAGSREPSDDGWYFSVIREMKEEVGYLPLSIKKIGDKFYPLSDRVDNPCRLYVALDCQLTDQAKQDELQGVECLICTRDEVLQMVGSGAIRDLATAAGIFAALLIEDSTYYSNFISEGI